MLRRGFLRLRSAIRSAPGSRRNFARRANSHINTGRRGPCGAQQRMPSTDPWGFINNELSRRALFRQVLGAGGVASLPFWLQLRAAAANPAAERRRSLILLWQDGGPSHFETFDPKPDAPAEIRGELGAIRTTLPGVAYCEVLPRLARLAHRTSVIRSLHQSSSDHVVGSHNVLTGWEDATLQGKSRFPDLACVINRMRSGEQAALRAVTDPRRLMAGKQAISAGSPSSLQYVDIGGGLHRGGPAFLGSVSGPFQVMGDPSKPAFSVQNLQALEAGPRFQNRLSLLKSTDSRQAAPPPDTAGFAQVGAVAGFRRQAIDLISGAGTAKAFDLSREAEATRERYGSHLAGRQCLLARRLVEAGVGVVAVRFSPDGRGDYDRTMIGWDDHAVHGNIFDIMRRRGPQFDQALSALIEDLEDRGMDEDVLVVVVGEFGRTPRIHVHRGCPGREHWGQAGCALVFGGGLKMGQVIGATSERGEHPSERAVGYPDLLATIYHAMGVDSTRTLLDPAGRPVPILPAGEPIRELVG